MRLPDEASLFSAATNTAKFKARASGESPDATRESRMLPSRSQRCRRVPPARSESKSVAIDQENRGLCPGYLLSGIGYWKNPAAVARREVPIHDSACKSIVPFLLDAQAKEAVAFYLSIFKVRRRAGAGGLAQVLTVSKSRFRL